MTKMISVLFYSILLISFLCLIVKINPAHAGDPPAQNSQTIYPGDYISLSQEGGMGGQPLLPVKVNGTQSAVIMADTGSTFSILSPEIAKRLGLVLAPATRDNGDPFLWKGKPVQSTWLPALEIGDLTLLKIPFRILEDQDFMLSANIPGATRYDGILGANIMEHFAVLLDGPQHKFSLCMPGNMSLEQVGQTGLAHPYTIPIMKGKNSQWYVHAQFANSGASGSEALVLDTGSNTTEVSDTLAQALRLKISGRQGKHNLFSNSVVGKSSTEEMHLGDLTLLGTPLIVSSISEKEPPLLGMDILSNYRVLIDFPAKKMYLQPNPAAVSAITISPVPAVAETPGKQHSAPKAAP